MYLQRPSKSEVEETAMKHAVGWAASTALRIRIPFVIKMLVSMLDLAVGDARAKPWDDALEREVY